MNQPIEDRAAIVFAQGFYEGLGYDNSDNLDVVIQRAFDEGVVAIQLENLLQGAIPSIWKSGIAQRDIETTSLFDKSSSNRNNEVITSTLKSSSDDLSSDRNVDYTPLRNLLADEEWKKADQETLSVMLRIIGRESGDWIRDKELLNFPCTDLRTIDSLWVKYSNGHFGFSVQKKIYLNSDGKPDAQHYKEAWEKFSDCVGWRKSRILHRDWIAYADVTFDTSAPEGHLPAVLLSAGEYWDFRRERWKEFSSVVSRLVSCKI